MNFHHKYLLKYMYINFLGEKWRKHRKLITPTFHFKILEQFVDVFNAQSEILVEKLQAEVGTESFDIQPFISLSALDIICGNTFLFTL